MRKNILFFLLMVTASFQVAAQEGANSSPGSQGNTIIIDESYSTLRDMEGEIIYLKSQVTSLNNRITFLEAELTELRETSATQGNLLNNMVKNMTIRLRWGFFFLILLLFVITAALIYYVIFYNQKKQRVRVNKRQTDAEKKSENSTRIDVQDYTSYKDSGYSSGNSGSRAPGDPSFARPPANTGTSPGLYPQRKFPEEPKPKPPADKKINLYLNSEERDKRLNSTPGDVFLDISKSVAERMYWGETVSPVFEKKGTRISAMFVLVNNQDLYPNFYLYNETNELPDEKEKVLSMIYNIEGILPGNIVACEPVKVSPPDRDGCYKLSGYSKGRLRIR